MTLDMDDPQMDASLAFQANYFEEQRPGSGVSTPPLRFAGENGFPGDANSRTSQETLQIKPAEANRQFDPLQQKEVPGLTLRPTGAQEVRTSGEEIAGIKLLGSGEGLETPLRPKNQQKHFFDDTGDYTAYDDKFPSESQFVLRLLQITIPLSSFSIAIAYFISLFAAPLTYNVFWNVFVFVAIHVMILVASFRAKSFLKWCFKNCRVLIRKQYILFIQAITVQCYYYSFAKEQIVLLVGSAFVLFGSLFVLIGLVIWVVGLIRHR